jgi:hypothetical protein
MTTEKYSKAARTRSVCLQLLRQHEQMPDGLPTSIRFLFYELEQQGLATKPSPDDMRPNKRRSIGWPPGEQDIIDAVTWLREEGLIPWHWIADETRSLSEWLYADTVIDYVRDRVGEATINPWGEEPPPLILCESRATAGVLRAVVSRYVCPIAGTAGQSHGFLRSVVGALFDDGARRVLYLGDLDFSGGLIEANTHRVLERARGFGLDWERLGMTAEQAEALDITPIVKRDGRTREFHEAIEVEALGQAGLIELVRDALDDLLPEPLERVQERARAEAEAVARFLASWRDQ